MVRFRLMSAILLLTSCVSAQAEIKFAIGEPADGSTRSGIGQISGWAVSDSQIVSVEAFIDGVSIGLVPYGGIEVPRVLEVTYLRRDRNLNPGPAPVFPHPLDRPNIPDNLDWPLPEFWAA